MSCDESSRCARVGKGREEERRTGTKELRGKKTEGKGELTRCNEDDRHAPGELRYGPRLCLLDRKKREVLMTREGGNEVGRRKRRLRRTVGLCALVKLLYEVLTGHLSVSDWK
jgi:hypothetical protein